MNEGERGAIERFIDCLSMQYGVPKVTQYKDEARKSAALTEFYADLAKKLKAFPEDVVLRAAELIRDTGKFKAFPPIRECVEGCELVVRLQKREEQKQEQEQKKARDWTNSDVQAGADAKLAKCKDLALRAHREGWLFDLWVHLAEWSGFPDDSKCDEISRSRVGLADRLTRFDKHPDGLVCKSCASDRGGTLRAYDVTTWDADCDLCGEVTVCTSMADWKWRLVGPALQVGPALVGLRKAMRKRRELTEARLQQVIGVAS